MPPVELLDYYRRRAREYERVYDKPERQADLGLLADSVRSAVEDRSVLEVACGTGYWAEHYASVADRNGRPGWRTLGLGFEELPRGTSTRAIKPISASNHRACR